MIMLLYQPYECTPLGGGGGGLCYWINLANVLSGGGGGGGGYAVLRMKMIMYVGSRWIHEKFPPPYL